MNPDLPVMTVLDAAPDPDESRPRRAGGPVVTALLVAALFLAGVAIGAGARGGGVVGSPRPDPGLTRPHATAGSGAADARRNLPVTVDALLGVWFEDAGIGISTEPVLVRFSDDGTFALGGALVSDAWVSGTYQVRATSVTFRPTGGACGAAEDFAWHVSPRDEGRLEAVHLGSDGSSGGRRDAVGDCRVPVGEPYLFTRVSPASGAAEATVLPGYVTPAGPLVGAADARLAGYWWEAGTGRLWKVGTDGRYAFDDSGVLATDPLDTGAVDGDLGSLRFTSDGAGGCAVGDTMRWDDARIDDGRLRATVRGDGCGRGLPREIVLVSLDAHVA